MAAIPFISETEIKRALPRRSLHAHKGDFGHVLIVGGSSGMTGAACMAGTAALRVGAGLVSIATQAEQATAITAGTPELMCHVIERAAELLPLLAKATVVVIGPGLGQSAWAQHLFTFLLTAVQQPVLLDADALNLLAKQPQQRSDWVLTPHAGEAGRLLQKTAIEVQQDRVAAVQALQHRYGGVVVLKGAGTLVQGQQLACCPAGNPGMATGGMGDILSGVIGGLMAQGLEVETAARVGVLLHAQAGDLAAQQQGERGMLATDLLPYLHQLVNP